MLVELEPGAQNYILQKGKSAMIILGNMRGCCGGVLPVPKIYLGSPKDPSGYEENRVGDVSIFIDKKLVDTGTIRVTHAKLLSLNKLSVEIGGLQR